jgi:hypothetical protein
MSPHLRTVVLVALVLAAISSHGATGAPDRATRSFLIQASASFQRLGDYWISDDATYAGAIRALGSADACHLVGRDPAHVVAVWRSLGVRIDLRTYGFVPPGKTGCTAPDQIHVSTVRVTARRWYTSLRLRVGESTSRLTRLYRKAKESRAVPGWYGRGYWLVTRRTACLGECGDTRFVTAPVLVAETNRGRVVSFVFVVGAQGE